MKIKHLILLILLIITPTISFAKDTEPVKVYFDEYYQKKYIGYLSDLTKKAGLSDRIKLLGELTLKKLDKDGRKVVIANSKEETDFQVVFTFSKVLTLPKNKHYEISTTPYRFKSQWMEGELYIKENKVVGGNIVIRISSHMRLKELYYILEQEWNKIPMKAEEQIYPPGIFFDIYREYEKATEKYKAREKRLDGKPWDTPSKEEVDKMFSNKGETTLMLAQLMRITPPRIHAGILGNQMKKCIGQAKDFYIKLYSQLFDQIFRQAEDNADSNIIHDVTPSEKIFRKLHNASGDYNCFITNSKLTEFSK